MKPRYPLRKLRRQRAAPAKISGVGVRNTWIWFRGGVATKYIKTVTKCYIIFQEEDAWRTVFNFVLTCYRARRKKIDLFFEEVTTERNHYFFQKYKPFYHEYIKWSWHMCPQSLKTPSHFHCIFMHFLWSIYTCNNV